MQAQQNQIPGWNNDVRNTFVPGGVGLGNMNMNMGSGQQSSLEGVTMGGQPGQTDIGGGTNILGPQNPYPFMSPVRGLGDHGLRYALGAVTSPGWTPQGQNQYQQVLNQYQRSQDDLNRQASIAAGQQRANMSYSGLDSGELERLGQGIRRDQIMGQQDLANQRQDAVFQLGVEDANRKDKWAQGLAGMDWEIWKQNNIIKHLNEADARQRQQQSQAPAPAPAPAPESPQQEKTIFDKFDEWINSDSETAGQKKMKEDLGPIYQWWLRTREAQGQ